MLVLDILCELSVDGGLASAPERHVTEQRSTDSYLVVTQTCHELGDARIADDLRLEWTMRIGLAEVRQSNFAILRGMLDEAIVQDESVVDSAELEALDAMDVLNVVV